MKTLLTPLVLMASVVLLMSPLVACSSTAPVDAAPAAAAVGEPAAPEAAIEDPAPQESVADAPSPPDGPSPLGSTTAERVGDDEDREWLVDDQGREFYTLEVERKPEYSLRPDDKVMLPPGVAYDIHELRDDAILVKVYNPDTLPVPDRLPQGREQGSRREDLTPTEPSTTDRLRFERSKATLPGNGQWRQGFEVVDMNGDGHLDLVHGPPRKGDGLPKIFLGDSVGGWRLWTETTYESDPLDYGDVAVADFDGDGHLDIALAIHLRGAVVLSGNGAGHFVQTGNLPFFVTGSNKQPPSYSSRTVEVVDWNRDGRPDLLTLAEGPRMARPSGGVAPGFTRGDRGPVLFLNNGDRTWEQYDQGVGRTRLFGDGLALGDFDGDGQTDFAIASRVSGATKIIKMGREDGTWEDVSLGSLGRPGTYGAVHAVDLDDDGREELLLGYGASGPSRERWAGIDLLDYEDGEWQRTPVLARKVEYDAVTALTTGDLDGDGHTDIVALTDTGQRWVLLGTPDGGFAFEATPELEPSSIGCQGYSAAVVPAGPGGRPTLVMGFAGEPGSEQLVVGTKPRCPSRGSLEAWTPMPAR